MKHDRTFNVGKIASGLQKGLKQGVGAVKHGAKTIKEKTGKLGRQGVQTLASLQKKSKESIKRVFRRAA